MSGGLRQTQNVWFYLQNRMFGYFLSTKLYRGFYFWEDSFITPFYQLIGCRLFGHRNTKWHKHEPLLGLSCLFCWNCQTRLLEVLIRHEADARRMLEEGYGLKKVSLVMQTIARMEGKDRRT